MIPYERQFMWYIRSCALIKDGRARSLICMSNNAQVHVYINSRELQAFLVLDDNAVTNGDGICLKS